LAGDVPFTTELAIGRPARTILSTVDERDVDLVVMGTRGAGGLPRRVLGSVTTYVVSHADVPVHVVPAATDE
jgi:nucleotide-binding universal stress UspA family protein